MNYSKEVTAYAEHKQFFNDKACRDSWFLRRTMYQDLIMTLS